MKVTAADLKAYDRTKRLAKHIQSDLRSRIPKIVRSVGDPNLVRGELSKPRIKSPTSLARKADERGWTFSDALSKTEDLVGLRIVCHNVQDVRRISTLIEKSLRNDGFKVTRRDYISKPKATGYRAVHLLFRSKVTVGNETADVGCEIQIRSLLQDAWARLSHADIYATGVGVPRSVERRMKSLSKTLAAADEKADGIRNQIARPVRGSRPVGAQPVTESALAFLYRERFGEDPPGYLIQAVLREIGGNLVRADGLHAALSDKPLVDSLAKAYEDASGFEPQPYQIFMWVVDSVLFGKEKAVRRAIREARQELNEIRSIAEREILGDKTAEEMLTSLEYAQKDDDPGGDLESWAGALGAARSCDMCGTTIVDPGAFARAAVKRSKVRGRRAERLLDELTDAAESEAIETGSWDNPGLCSNCSYVLGKDD